MDAYPLGLTTRNGRMTRQVAAVHEPEEQPASHIPSQFYVHLFNAFVATLGYLEIGYAAFGPLKSEYLPVAWIGSMLIFYYGAVENNFLTSTMNIYQEMLQCCNSTPQQLFFVVSMLSGINTVSCFSSMIITTATFSDNNRWPFKLMLCYITFKNMIHGLKSLSALLTPVTEPRNPE